MRVLINGLFVVPGRVGGSETYLRGLTLGLANVDTANDYTLVVGRDAAATFQPPNSRWRVVASPAPSRIRAARLLLEQTWLSALAMALRADLIHSGAYTSPLFSSTPRVTSILDMNYRRHPEDLSKAERAVYAAIIPLVAQRSCHVLTLSDAARDDILQWTHVRASHITTTPLAPRASWPGDPAQDEARLAAVRVERPYLLSVAAALPHKNIARLVQAFLSSEALSKVADLVVVGLPGKADGSIRASAAGSMNVKVLGWVDDGLLAALYRRAIALAFPSLHEGFGLPILEAMALGTPVVTSNFGATREVADDAAELVDPYDVHAIRDGLERVTFDDLRIRVLRQLGLARAAQFSWSRTAELTRRVYAQCCARG
jgi:glycosyltransferase involved in cell wall biosynthesis